MGVYYSSLSCKAVPRQKLENAVNDCPGQVHRAQLSYTKKDHIKPLFTIQLYLPLCLLGIIHKLYYYPANIYVIKQEVASSFCPL